MNINVLNFGLSLVKANFLIIHYEMEVCIGLVTMVYLKRVLENTLKILHIIDAEIGFLNLPVEVGG